MKNLSLIINVLLTVAVVVLFALHFSGKSVNTGPAPAAAVAAASTDLRIAFFNSDSLMEHYEMFKVERDAMEAKMKDAQTRFANKQRAFEKEAAEFQQRAQYLTITEKEAKEQRLYDQQQQLIQMQQQLSDELANAEQEVNLRIFETIETFLKEYAAQNNFTYVLSYSRGGGIWFADKRLDITSDILKTLNEEYSKKKAG